MGMKRGGNWGRGGRLKRSKGEPLQGPKLEYREGESLKAPLLDADIIH